MFSLLSIGRQWSRVARSLLFSACALLAAASTLLAEEKKPARLLDRQPFDRITLKSGEQIDTLLLELPNRQVPNPLPDGGSLQLRRLSEPSVLYNLPWTSIARLEFYEQLLLNESDKLARAGDLAQAYEYLSFLHKNYSSLAGLESATSNYLRKDAQASYAAKNYEETLTVLLSLYDLDPRQQGLAAFIETVTDRLITEHLNARDFAAARSVLDLLATGFPQLQLRNVRTWQGKFEQGAGRQVASARQAMDKEQYLEARRALRRAIAILPDATGVAELLDEIDRESPQIIVGVDQLGISPDNPLDCSTQRIRQLTQPRLLDLVGFGAEGGDYECSYAELQSDDSGLQLDLALNSAALQQGLTAERLALQLLRQADTSAPEFRADFAGLLNNVEINQGNVVSVHLRRAHVRPEPMLSLPLQQMANSSLPPGAYLPTIDRANNAVNYQLPKDRPSVGPQTVIEKFYDNEEVAFADLLNGEADVLARVPTWQITRLQQTAGITVAPYRLPTIHVLLPNYQKPLLGRREFRRAICYGIDRPQLLNNILLGGERRPGYRVLSAPLPAGIRLTDPVGYAYNQGIQPRPYEPRLAAVLAAVARNSLAKLAAMKAKAKQPKSEAAEKPDQEDKPVTAPVTPLVLAHPPNPVATAVCQSIKLQLGAIGIPVQLKALSSLVDEQVPDYDLRYAEICLGEPIVDARRLLGTGGVAGTCSSSMSLALADVDRANNWKEARARLQEVHQIAFNDLPVIPLWQTIDYYAYRDSLQGIGETPVTLYQNITEWKRMTPGGRR